MQFLKSQCFLNSQPTLRLKFSLSSNRIRWIIYSCSNSIDLFFQFFFLLSDSDSPSCFLIVCFKRNCQLWCANYRKELTTFVISIRKRCVLVKLLPGIKVESVWQEPGRERGAFRKHIWRSDSAFMNSLKYVGIAEVRNHGNVCGHKVCL